MNPSWKQFSQITFDDTVFAAIKALGVEIPPEGRPRTFMVGELMAHHTHDERWLVKDKREARYVDGPQTVLKIAQFSAGTPSGDALQQWLLWWGWVPKSQQQPNPLSSDTNP
jgi:hypothetical protein